MIVIADDCIGNPTPGEPSAHHHPGGRVVYDALGHDPRSYDSTGHMRFDQRSIAWLLGEL